MLDWLNTEFLGIFRVWQIPLAILLVILIIFWKKYRSKQT